MAASLDNDQIRRYHQDGFLFPLDILDATRTRNYRLALEEIESRYARARLPRPLNQYLRVNAHYVLPLAAELARLPAILDVVESILGPEILIWSCEFFIKETAGTKVVSWHQDLTYWGLGETDAEITAWLALSPATRESGCMRFLAGSHQQRILPHRDTFNADNLLSRGQEIAVEVNESEALPVLLAPGQMSLHHGRMCHASGPNTSGDRRIGVAIRYLSPEVVPTASARDFALRARGNAAARQWELLPAPEQSFCAAALERYEQVLAAQSPTLAQGAGQQVGLYS